MPLGWAPSRPSAPEPIDDGLVYRLKHWPDLPSAVRTADVFRLLSVMSHRAVSRRWMLAHTRLEPIRLDMLLRRLRDRADVEVIDVRAFRAAD
jgi:hypothetical protein